MIFRVASTLVASCIAGLLPGLAFAQSVNVTRSILPTQPYTLIYPEPMLASGDGIENLTINHPNAPLQCDLSVVAVEDTDWQVDDALNSLDDAEVSAGWAQTFPGFAVSNKTIAQFQDTSALLYEGTSTDSPQGVPLTIVHAETVSGSNGYALDCLYATVEASSARPVVDFIIANFSTRPDAECCIGVDVEQPEPVPAQ